MASGGGVWPVEEPSEEVCSRFRRFLANASCVLLVEGACGQVEEACD